MPSFPNPFQGNVDREISKGELIQALRIDIAGELEAIYLYDAHVMATTDPLVKKVLADIRDEEKQHCGELMALLRYLEPEIDDLLNEGAAEVKEMMDELGIKEPKLKKAPTVGSLTDE